MEKEEIKINFSEIPYLSSGEEHRTRTVHSPISIAITFAAVILIGASLTIHAALMVKAIRICKNDGGDILLSAVLPTAVTSNINNEKVDNKSVKKKNSENENPDTPASGNGSVSYINCDLSSKEKNALALMNETSLLPDIVQIAKRKRPLMTLGEISSKYGQDSPAVLIYHTHGTESYCECAESSFRSEDITKNVVAVGTSLTEELEKYGIKAIHLKEMYDIADFNGAYDRSTTAVRAVLGANPSIQFMLDIHRDSVDRNGEYIKCASRVDGNDAAQLMFVVGTDEGGSGHTGWQDNLAVALQLQSAMWNKSDSIMRPVDLKEASFYQDTGPGALIVEFGSCGNSLNEAKASAKLFASVIYGYLKG